MIKMGFFTPKIAVHYIGGHPAIKPGLIIIEKTKEKNLLKIDKQMVRVLKIEWDEKGKRSAGKTAVGAIIGTALLPGVGTLIGGALGAKRKDTSLAIITSEIDGLTTEIYFRADKKKYQRIISLLR